MPESIQTQLDFEQIKCKLHFRKRLNGTVYVQGVIPSEYAFLINNILDNDSVGVVDIGIHKKYLIDKTKEFAGLSNEVIMINGI